MSCPGKACSTPHFTGVPRARPAKIPIVPGTNSRTRHHRARRSIERLIKAIDELQSRIGVVRRHKRRRRSRELTDVDQRKCGDTVRV